MKSQKIAILSLPYGPNYGCVLQQWALYTYIKKQGYSVISLNRRWNRKRSFSNWLKSFVYLNFFICHFSSFYKKLKHSPELRSTEELKDFIKTEGIDTVIVGSDQIWRIENTRGADLNFFCDFAETAIVKKIAYAASFGNEIWKGTAFETTTITRLLKKFRSISVREENGVKMCKTLFDCSAEKVLDPTMLLETSDYSIFCKKKQKKYLATYILDDSPEIRLNICRIAKQLELSEISLYPQKKRLLSYKAVPQWINYISNSDYIFVDSFHGLVFSIMFHRQFLVLINKKRGASRIFSLLTDLNLENRAINDFNDNVFDKLMEKIDYDSVDAKLKVLKEKSKEFLSISLEA